MHSVVSKDGTTIAYEQAGSGPPVILVGGAFSYREFPQTKKLVGLLAERFTVVNYDRRGRGDSGDTRPYAVQREIEDLDALIAAAGGSASVWGQSSGGVLALRAAAAGSNISKLAVYQPPFSVARGDHVPPAGFEAQLRKLVAADQRSAAVRWFMSKAMGMPAVVGHVMRLTPMWSKLKAVAHTLPYDYMVMGDTVHGKPLVADEWSGIVVPTLVLHGGKAPDAMKRGAKALNDLLPQGRLRALEGQSHNVSIKVLAPVLAGFFAAAEPARSEVSR